MTTSVLGLVRRRAVFDAMELRLDFSVGTFSVEPLLVGFCMPVMPVGNPGKDPGALIESFRKRIVNLLRSHPE